MQVNMNCLWHYLLFFLSLRIKKRIVPQRLFQLFQFHYLSIFQIRLFLAVSFGFFGVTPCPLLPDHLFCKQILLSSLSVQK